MSKTSKSSIALVLKGAAMGIAEVIPGVSGGTIAFITGIYEKLLQTIKAFGPQLITILKKDGIKGAWEHINGSFLMTLLTGMAIGLIGGVFVITKILDTYPEFLWAFFFGLIIASAIYIGKQISKWGGIEIVNIIVGTLVAYYITVATPATGNEALWFVFICGAIAISALILPGISGSFMLLLMGMYGYIIPTVKEALTTFDATALTVLAVFAMGCLTGLMTFSRFLSWTFKNYRNPTLAILTGFMIGSLNKLWPWRNVLSTRINSKGEEVPFLEESVLPYAYDGDPQIIGVLLCMVIGFSIVFLLERFGNKENQ